MADFAVLDVKKSEILNHRAENFRIGVQLIGNAFQIRMRAHCLSFMQILNKQSINTITDRPVSDKQVNNA